jgi:hypothetical protein
MLWSTSLTYNPFREDDLLVGGSPVRASIHATVNDPLTTPTIPARCANYPARTVAASATRPFPVPPP